MQPVLVSYSGSPFFLSSPSWTQIQHGFNSQLPLRNIHWKSASRTSLRTIQELNVTLVNLDSIRDEHTSQVPVNLLEKPLLNIYIVNCEDADLESYRTTVKKQVRDWHVSVTSRRNQEWLILQIVKPDGKAPTGTFLKLKGSVLDKLRADFNADKRERCVQVSWSSTQDSPIAWGEFLNKLKDGISSAFDTAVLQKEDDVKRSEGQRLMPGWNFCTFFILKESLASSFEGMNLVSEALVQYDELEASFYQVLKEKNLSWFGTLITPGPKDDSSPLLSISKKPYRDLILANTISVFDFRTYLLTRQCELLAKYGRLPEVCRRVGAFLGAFGRRLREIEETLPLHFVESWIYSSALSVVEKCDAWHSSLKVDQKKLASFYAGKGELLELARSQLDTLGMKTQHLPCRAPFSGVSDVSAKLTKTSSSQMISNDRLLKALEDKEAFYDLYINITNRAIDMYAKAGRRKFALKLHGSLAALDVHRGRLSTALTTYTSLPAHYAPHKWTSLQSLMLSRALDIHESLEKPKDREWMHILLSSLSIYIESGAELLLCEQNAQVYVSRLVGELKNAASELDQDLVHTDLAAVTVHAPSDARPASGRDGYVLDVMVQNHLPCDLPVDEVCIVLYGADACRLKFTVPCESLPAGKTTVTLFCPTPLSGTYLLDTSEVRVSRLVFQQTHRKPVKVAKSSKDKGILIRLPRDPLAMNVRVSLPRLIVLGSPSIVINVLTGRNEIVSMTIRLSSPSATFQRKNISLESGVGEMTGGDDGVIMLSGIGRGESVSVSVPHSEVSGAYGMKVHLQVEYVTKAEPTISRVISVVRSVQVTHPIVVNVEDFFRGTRLFTKFTISTASHQHVRIARVELDPSDAGVKVVSCGVGSRVITVTPAQCAHFLFCIDGTDGPGTYVRMRVLEQVILKSLVREPMRLRVRFRMLREEVEKVIEEATSDIVVVDQVVRALERDGGWVERYSLTGELDVPEGEEIGSKLREELSTRRALGPDSGSWREMQIPVDVPSMNIVAAVRIKLSGQSCWYAGQPISAVLSIETSFHWDASGEKDAEYRMRYDVEELVRDWLVSGRKRGDFSASHNGTYSVGLTMIAVHHGELMLPKVSVWAEGIQSTETYQINGAEKVLVQPRGGRTTFITDMC
ncbi:uncharacterized protein BT62DRAFT_939661 [Guyanagaster necrorhizus]|uniref:Trafficking protein particle complex subunit 10 n=1 Tax=Guyanagaster necrorhizus TaxID=856835 RepID=A0A9P7W3B1_9AGAR|nr:uncharacterized protein BT62DRAFT_939661 [Guyanagaster necrorhizus MCA 3950]KAG7452626.1 hypothetical protein BT62DRAFT_939661 [Guyanagaster necrorhizus MCA 3950]